MVTAQAKRYTIEDVYAELTFGNDDIEVWDLWSIDNGRKAGQLVLSANQLDDLNVWVVMNVNIRDPFRERSLMRKFIKMLGYPFMCSCLMGATSPDAVRMFEALGAEKRVTDRCPKGFVYLLTQ